MVWSVSQRPFYKSHTVCLYVACKCNLNLYVMLLEKKLGRLLQPLLTLLRIRSFSLQSFLPIYLCLITTTAWFVDCKPQEFLLCFPLPRFTAEVETWASIISRQLTWTKLRCHPGASDALPHPLSPLLSSKQSVRLLMLGSECDELRLRAILSL